MIVSYSRQIGFELVEGRVPAAVVAVTRAFIEELLVREHQERAVAVRLEFDGDQRLPLGCRLPGPRVDDLAVRNRLVNGAGDAVIFALRTARVDHETSAGARFENRFEDSDAARTEPARYLRRLCPRAVDPLRCGLEAAADGEAWLDGCGG